MISTANYRNNICLTFELYTSITLGQYEVVTCLREASGSLCMDCHYCMHWPFPLHNPINSHLKLFFSFNLHPKTTKDGWVSLCVFHSVCQLTSPVTLTQLTRFVLGSFPLYPYWPNACHGHQSTSVLFCQDEKEMI